MGVEDHFQMTLVESQVQTDFPFSSAILVRTCLLVSSLPPCPHTFLTLPEKHLAANGARQESNKSLNNPGVQW